MARDFNALFLFVALQHGLFAIGWAFAAWGLGLSRRAALHWVLAMLLGAGALVSFVQFDRLHDLLSDVFTQGFALLGAFALRRGIQIFLRLPLSDLESSLLLVGAAIVLGLHVIDPMPGAPAVLVTTGMMSWTLLRTAQESWSAFQHVGDRTAGLLVAAPLTLLGSIGVVYGALRLVGTGLFGLPLPNEAAAFDLGAGLALTLSGLVLNMVLSYMVASRLVRRLNRLAQHDPLTGLLNRRALMPLLAREAGRLKRYRERYALLMIDIDHFKAVNDKHGHAAGDAALVALGGLLRDAAREVDRAARIGGEEFCLLLPHTDLDGAVKLGQRVTEIVRAARWQGIDERLSVSVGVAVATDPEEAPEAVMRRADVALYRAKELGRDRVVLAEPARLYVVPV